MLEPCAADPRLPPSPPSPPSQSTGTRARGAACRSSSFSSCASRAPSWPAAATPRAAAATPRAPACALSVRWCSTSPFGAACGRGLPGRAARGPREGSARLCATLRLPAPWPLLSLPLAPLLTLPLLIHTHTHTHPPTPPHSYSLGDRVERWLNDLLCLDAAEHTPAPPARLPHPDECELFYVERDTLFSYHKVGGQWVGRALLATPASWRWAACLRRAALHARTRTCTCTRTRHAHSSGRPID